MDILKKHKGLWDENNLNKSLLFELLENYDKELFELLLTDKEIKAKFFVQAGESYVFKYEDFRFAIEQNNLDGSYTKYANTIGFSNKGKFLSESTDYVLDWPYKDCVLEGGMSSEEDTDTFIEKKVETTPGKMDKKTGTVISTEKTVVTFSQAKRKREEIFYNNIIADKEIDRLLDKKALKNFTRYTAKDEEKVQEIKRDEDGTIKENLLIKGNNLLALHSLKEQFAGKVKLIYIDPPYNTGNDGFAYNDRFNHSTWLTFMKNRLEIAKEFLREDGVVAIQCDDNEQAYLTLVCDQIFGQNNRLNTICVKMSEASGVKMAHTESRLPKLKEYILIYRNTIQPKINEYKVKIEKWNNEYKNILLGLTEEEINEVKTYLSSRSNSNLDLNKCNKILKKGKIQTLDEYLKENPIKHNQNLEEWKFQNAWRIIQAVGSSSVLKLAKLQKNFNQDIAAVLSKTNLIYLYKTEFDKSSKQPRVQIIFADDSLMQNPGDFWKDIKTTGGVGTEGGVILKNGKKPEQLIHRLISIFSNKNDIVMDFHLGSGTTAAVALKTIRQFIGIEQIEYQDNSALTRLKNVIGADSTGISKEVNWKGGGDFIYFELAEYNEEAKNKIDACTSFKELKKLFTELTDYYFLNYNVSVKQFNDQILNDKDFQELPLEEQKVLFKALLDNNQLYISYDEQNDTRFKLSEEDRKLTKIFYE